MTTKSMNCKQFTIGHVSIVISTENNAVLERLAVWLNVFEVPNQNNVGKENISVTLHCLEIGEAIPYNIPTEAIKTFEGENAIYYTYKDLWIVDHKELGLMLVNRQTLEITGYAYYHYILRTKWDIENYMHPCFELMRQKNLYVYHSAAVSYGEKGILISGKSGQGKSTLSVDLVENGFDFLSDDRCFLRDYNDRVEMIGLYEPARLYPSNITHIDALRELKGLPVDHKSKNKIDIRSIYPKQMKSSSMMSGLVFPHFSPGEKSRIEIMPPGKALVDLLPLTLVCFDQETGKSQFEFIGKLVQNVTAVKLIMGDDRENWHKLVKEYISQI